MLTIINIILFLQLVVLVFKAKAEYEKYKTYQKILDENIAEVRALIARQEPRRLTIVKDEKK